MKLIVGLGNPGSQYDKTRHNAGFVVVDRVLKRWASAGDVPKSRFQGLAQDAVVKGERCLMLKPLTYMNLSGRSVQEAIGFYKLDPANDLLVVVDDVSIPCGTLRVRASGSAGGHNGLADIERALGTQTYPRLRVGVDPCPPMMKLEDYVLGRFTPEQESRLAPAIDKAADAVEVFASQGLTRAMNTFNAAPALATAPPPTPASPATVPQTPKSTNQSH